ncbi:hypothetical protein F3K40_07915 [Streptomyces sp. LBUM 1478]|uniref:hypothetical protein n=1 Tax=Streptomyces scabiei TaxID=1930 RepID=UPI00059F5E2E|nr:hypothetical protein [Streptomyces sp. LBUM 1478]
MNTALAGGAPDAAPRSALPDASPSRGRRLVAAVSWTPQCRGTAGVAPGPSRSLTVSGLLHPFVPVPRDAMRAYLSRGGRARTTPPSCRRPAGSRTSCRGPGALCEPDRTVAGPAS